MSSVDIDHDTLSPASQADAPTRSATRGEPSTQRSQREPADPSVGEAPSESTAVDTADAYAQIRHRIEAVVADHDAVVEVILARGAQLAQATLGRVAFEADVAAEIAADVAAYARGIAARHLLAYDPSYQSDTSQALVEGLAELPTLHEVQARLEGADLPFDACGGEPLVAVAYVLRGGGRQVVAYRLKGAGLATRRARGLLVLVPHDGVYQRADDILMHEPAFDALVVGPSVCVTAVSTFAARLDAPVKAQRMARETFTAVVADLHIDGLSDLTEAVVHDPAMRAKVAVLHRLLTHDPDYRARLTMPALLAFIDAHPHLEIELTGEGAARRLRFDRSPQQRFKIVKLLADDYLTSPLTQRDYEAGSKARIHR